MADFFIHVFYFLTLYYRRNRDSAFVGLFLLLSLNMMAISWTFDLHLIDRFLTGDAFRDRWVILPIVTSPIPIGIYLYYRMNKSKVEAIIEELDSNEVLRKKQKVRVIVYVVLTVVLWILAIFIPPIKLP